MIVYGGVLEINVWILGAALALTFGSFGWLFATALRQRKLVDALVKDGMDRKVVVAQIRLRRHPIYLVAIVLATSLVWMKEFAMSPILGMPAEATEMFRMRRIAAVCLAGTFLVIAVVAELVGRRIYRNRLKEKRS